MCVEAAEEALRNAKAEAEKTAAEMDAETNKKKAAAAVRVEAAEKALKNAQVEAATKAENMDDDGVKMTDEEFDMLMKPVMDAEEAVKNAFEYAAAAIKEIDAATEAAFAELMAPVEAAEMALEAAKTALEAAKTALEAAETALIEEEKSRIEAAEKALAAEHARIYGAYGGPFIDTLVEEYCRTRFVHAVIEGLVKLSGRLEAVKMAAMTSGEKADYSVKAASANIGAERNRLRDMGIDADKEFAKISDNMRVVESVEDVQVPERIKWFVNLQHLHACAMVRRNAMR